MTQIVLPVRARGRQSVEACDLYQLAVREFCRRVLQINSGLDFRVSSRGWGYLLEPKGLLKGDFDKAQKLINDLRKSGDLPVDLCSEDAGRASSETVSIDETSPREEASALINYARTGHQHYHPFALWDTLDVYVEMWVEKVDLYSLFDPVCQDFQIQVTNISGWSDINSRRATLQHFVKWFRAGKRCVLLYCGDLDPGGLNISQFIRDSLLALANITTLDENGELVREFEPGEIEHLLDSLIIERFGLNRDFVEANNLTWIDNLETSSGMSLADEAHNDHWKDYVQDYIREYGVRKVEANALVVAPAAGRQLCLDAIHQYVSAEDLAAYDRQLVREQRKVRTEVRRQLRQLRRQENDRE